MATLTNNVAIPLKKGDYIYSAIMSAGTVTFEFDMDGIGFNPIPDGAITASGAEVIHLPDCEFRAVITGDAVVAIKMHENLNIPVNYKG